MINIDKEYQNIIKKCKFISTSSYSEMTLDEYNQLIREQKLKRIIK